MSSPTPLPPNPRLKALALLSTFSTLDTATNLALRTPNSIWRMLPRSLGFQDQTNESYAQRMSMMPRILSAFPVTPLEVTEMVTVDAETGNEKAVVSVHAEGQVVLREEVRELLERDEEGKKLLEQGEKNGGLQNEYLFIFTFEGTGEDAKIEKVVEWLDVDLSRVLMGIFARAMALVGGT